MTELTDRERHILTERRLKDEPTTLEDLASQYGVSRERVRQIEVRAFEKLHGITGLSRDWDSYRVRNDEHIIAEILEAERGHIPRQRGDCGLEPGGRPARCRE